ncbi:hypothetical protein OIU76_021862 [Salix suchowensis]|nr:hypothetical protein OIU76_021862 [Salix suchowensis]
MRKAIYKPPKAIRGGIPICFPQFGSHGFLEHHGFARNRFWSNDTDPPPFPTNSKSFIDLILKPFEEDMPKWPHSYEFRLRVALGTGGDLMLTSRIRNANADGKPFTFTFAYHTYFSVLDIRVILSLYSASEGDGQKAGGGLLSNFEDDCTKKRFLMS